MMRIGYTCMGEQTDPAALVANAVAAEDAGFVYYGIGRTLPPPATERRRSGAAAKSGDIRQATH